MLNRNLLWIAALFACCMVACGPENKTTNIGLIGTWSLQQQKIVSYVDGVKKTDTSVTASSSNFGNLKFNSNSTYLSSSFWASSGAGSGPAVAVDTARGTYSYVAGNLSISNSVAGLSNGISSGLIFGSGSVGIITLISRTVSISDVTASGFTLHMDQTVSLPITGGTQIIRSVSDYYYKK